MSVSGMSIAPSICALYQKYSRKDVCRILNWERDDSSTIYGNKIKNNERGLKILLFVKKCDGEGTDFYYMGQAEPLEWAQTIIENDAGKQLPIMNFLLGLKKSVREDIYDYLMS